MKIAVVGAGAAGLVASIVLKNKNADFTLFERGQRAGKKLLATGNGRCNLTNLCIDKSRYHGNADFAEFCHITLPPRVCSRVISADAFAIFLTKTPNLI